MAGTLDDRIIFATLLSEEVNLFQADVIQFYLTHENKGKGIYQNCPPSKQSVSLIALDDRIFFVTLLGFQRRQIPTQLRIFPIFHISTSRSPSSLGQIIVE